MESLAGCMRTKLKLVVTGLEALVDWSPEWQAGGSQCACSVAVLARVHPAVQKAECLAEEQRRCRGGLSYASSTSSRLIVSNIS